tara:strand:- start:591 stop:1076 length:486 start_codon:yes stop_codon:yes gene_type:complete
MAKSADGGEAPDGAEVTLESVLSAINAIAGKVETLSDKVHAMEDAPVGKMQVIESPEQLISKLKAGQSTSGSHTIDPQHRRGGFRPDDIVRLVDGDKLTQIRAAGKLGKDDEVLGVVVSRMYRRRRDDMMKLKVNFPALGRGTSGEDGVMEDQLALVKAAA